MWQGRAGDRSPYADLKPGRDEPKMDAYSVRCRELRQKAKMRAAATTSAKVNSAMATSPIKPTAKDGTA